MIEERLDLELSEQLVRMAEEGRAIRAALSTEDPQFEYHPMMLEGRPQQYGTQVD
jgi:hypothetical protein